MSKQTALVTGSAKRIGKQIALALASWGFNIALHYNLSYKEVISLQKEISNFNTSCHLFNADLSNENDLASLITTVYNKFGNLHLLVNNASVFEQAPFHKTSFDIFNNNFNANFKAPFFLSKDFAAIASNGHIINILDAKISSVSPFYPAYNLSKITLHHFTKFIAKELAPNFRVNAIAPGYILPPTTTDLQYIKSRPSKIPLKIQASTQNITSSLKFLLDNNFMTGQVIFVDGGENLL